MSHAMIYAKGILAECITSLVELIDDIKLSHKHRKDVNRTISELSKLTDRELADLGMNRGMIRQVAEGTVNCEGRIAK